MGRKIFFILIFISSLHAQVLKVTNEGLILVQDSISNKRLTEDAYSNYKGKYRFYIEMDSMWMITNTGKYLLPTIEEDSFIVLQQGGVFGYWGAVKINGEEKASFGFIHPMDFFKKGKCYGFQNIGRPGSIRVGGMTQSYANNYRIKNRDGEILVNYSELIDTYQKSFLILGKSPSKCGIINSQMDTILPFIYTCTSWDEKNFGFSEFGYLSLKDPNGKCGVINHLGQILIPFEYDFIDDMGLDKITVKRGNKTGELDPKLNWVKKIK